MAKTRQQSPCQRRQQLSEGIRGQILVEGFTLFSLLFPRDTYLCLSNGEEIVWIHLLDPVLAVLCVNTSCYEIKMIHTNLIQLKLDKEIPCVCIYLVKCKDHLNDTT